MWKANGNTTILLLSLDSLFPKQRYTCEMLPLETNNPEVNYSLIRISGGVEGWSVSRENIQQQVPLNIQQQVPLNIQQQVPLNIQQQVPLNIKQQVPLNIKQQGPLNIQQQGPPNIQHQVPLNI
jgi:hypothetical protein